MMQDTMKACAGRTEELLLKLDGELDQAAGERLGRHVAECPVCLRLMAGLRALDSALASRLAAPALTDSFDRSVLARLNALPQDDRESPAAMRARAERDRIEALSSLRKSVRRSLGASLLDLTGLAAILWAGGHMAPRLLDFVAQFGTASPVVAYAGSATALVALAIAAAFLVARVQHFAAAA